MKKFNCKKIVAHLQQTYGIALPFEEDKGFTGYKFYRYNFQDEYDRYGETVNEMEHYFEIVVYSREIAIDTQMNIHEIEPQDFDTTKEVIEELDGYLQAYLPPILMQRFKSIQLAKQRDERIDDILND